MVKVLVTGANGQFGSELKAISAQFKDMHFTFVDIDELDISNQDKVTKFIGKLKPNYIVNAAAYTAVDTAEEEHELAYRVNAEAVKYIAKAASNVGAKLIHISTDYVFNGQSYKPYAEGDETSPNSVYGNTKLKGEEYVISSGIGMVIRTAWLYSAYGKNFMKTILAKSNSGNLRVVFDQVGSPTWAHDLAMAIVHIIQHSKETFHNEIFHYTNEGVCSWYDFAKAILSIKGVECEIASVLSSEFVTKAKRPHYSVLNKGKIKKTFELAIPYWRDSLKECLKLVSLNDH
jgi:dTDP-4-dehydrorhamnose reductase